MIEATCHCGAVRIEVPAAPEVVTSCNCSICRRYGWVLAYYPASAVTVRGETDTYVWGDRMIAFHRCKVCGCGTHWSALASDRDRMGVNVRLMPPESVASARVRHLDGADTWTSFEDGPAVGPGPRRPW
jgi:hypothetical protein